MHIIRIQNLFIAGLCVFLSSYVLSNSLTGTTLLCFILVIFTMSFGYIMNDIIDLKSDKINHQQRMLVKNKISHKEA